MDFFLNALIVALFSFGLGVLIVRETGPFRLIERIKFALLPKYGRPEEMAPEWQKNEGLAFHEYLIEIEKHKASVDLWVNTWTKDVRYQRSFKGTVYGILTCERCFGLYADIIATILVYRSVLTTVNGLVLAVLTVFVGYALHRVLLRYF